MGDPSCTYQPFLPLVLSLLTGRKSCTNLSRWCSALSTVKIAAQKRSNPKNWRQLDKDGDGFVSIEKLEGIELFSDEGEDSVATEETLGDAVMAAAREQAPLLSFELAVAAAVVGWFYSWRKSQHDHAHRQWAATQIDQDTRLRIFVGDVGSMARTLGDLSGDVVV